MVVTREWRERETGSYLMSIKRLQSGDWWHNHVNIVNTTQISDYMYFNTI